MRPATRDVGTPDGQLLVVSYDVKRALPVPGWPNLLAAITDWRRAEHHLAVAAAKLGREDDEPLDKAGLRAPLPPIW